MPASPFGNLSGVVGKADSAGFKSFAKSEGWTPPKRQPASQYDIYTRPKAGNLSGVIGQADSQSYKDFAQQQAKIPKPKQVQQPKANIQVYKPPPAPKQSLWQRAVNDTENAGKASYHAAKAIVKPVEELGKGLYNTGVTVAKAPYHTAEMASAIVTGNKQAAKAADKRIEQDRSTIVDNVVHAPARALLEGGMSAVTALGKFEHKTPKANAKVFTPKPGIEQTVFGKQPVQNLQTLFQKTKKTQGTQAAVAVTGLETVLDLLVGKGAADVFIKHPIEGATDLSGQIPKEKSVTQTIKIPNWTAREFVTKPNPRIDDATAAKLSKALADNKQQFVKELRAGEDITSREFITKPTVYGKLLGIIQKKAKSGVDLTKNESNVVNTVVKNPEYYTGTSEIAKVPKQLPSGITEPKPEPLAASPIINSIPANELVKSEAKRPQPVPTEPAETTQENPPEAQQLWEDKYSDKYGDLSQQESQLRNTLKSVKKAEREGVQSKIDKLNNKMTQLEKDWQHELLGNPSIKLPPNPLPVEDHTAFSERYSKDYHDQLIKDYQQRTMQEFKLDRPNVASADEMKYAFPGYQDDPSANSQHYQVAASKAASAYYESLLKDKAHTGDRVLLMGGGPGAGKTTALRTFKENGSQPEQFAAIYDTNLPSMGSVEMRVNQALKTDHPVSIVFVYRDPLEAFTNGNVARSIGEGSENGRVVPVFYHARIHVGALETIKEAIIKYKNNPDVEIEILDNTRKPGDAQLLDGKKMVDFINDKSHNIDELTQRLHNELERLKKNGTVDEARYAAYKHVPEHHREEAAAINRHATTRQPESGGKTVPRPESKTSKGSVKPPAKLAKQPQKTKATASIEYPETKELPEHLKGKVPISGDTSSKEAFNKLKATNKLTPTELNEMLGRDIDWRRTDLKTLLQSVPQLKANPVLTVEEINTIVGHGYRARANGDKELALAYKDKTHNFRLPLGSLGITQKRLRDSGLKPGDTIDISSVMKSGTNKVPVVKVGKTMFSSTSGSRSTPKQKVEVSGAGEQEINLKEALTPKQVSNPVKQYIKSLESHKKVAASLDDKLFALGGESVADQIALKKLITTVSKAVHTPADWTAVYHYAEDKSYPVTPAQRDLYDMTVKPLQDGIDKMRKEMGLTTAENDAYIHRIAQEKGSKLQRFLEGDSHDLYTGNVLTQTADSMKGRVWHKLVDDKGNTRIVAIQTPKDQLGKALGAKSVTWFNHGQKTSMGALKRKLPPQAIEFTDPKLMQQLEDIAKGLGIEHERTNIPLKRGDRAAGVSFGNTNNIKTRVGSMPDTLLHEIGHQIDEKYNLWDYIVEPPHGEKQLPAQIEARQTINRELRELADQRLGEVSSKNMGKYVRTKEEKMAVLFQAYLHAPEIFQAVAPETFDKFETFLKSHPETAPITKIEKSLQLGRNQVGDVRHNGEFIDKTGKKWQIKGATTQEIEANSDTRYYKQPLVTTAFDYLQTRKALRARQFLEDWKTSPDFLYNPETGTGIAVKSDAPSIPKGWQTTKSIYFKGYYFEPRTAEVLDDFAKTHEDDPLKVFTKMNLFLRNTIFYNPLLHVPNIFYHALMRRGVSGLVNPIRFVRGTTSATQAINQIIHKGDLYQTMLREGAPLMSFDRQALGNLISDMMEKTIQDDAAVSNLAKLTGYASKANFIKAWYKVSSGVTWSSHDFFMLQAMIEEMKSRKMTPQQAIHEVTAHIPDYRLPTRFGSSRQAKVALSNHNATMFLPYHYGILKSYANTVREIAGETPRGSKKESGYKRIGTSARGVDKALMAGVIMFMIYPELDKIARSLTGNKNAIVRRAGPFTFPYAIYQMLHGSKTWQSTAQTVLPTPPGTKEIYGLVRDRDELNRQIFGGWQDWLHHPADDARRLGTFLATGLAPAATALQLHKGTKSPSQFAWSFLGISKPDPVKSRVMSLYRQQLNLGVESVEQQRTGDEKTAARNQILAGKGDSLAKSLLAKGVIANKSKLKEFEKSAKQNSVQRAFGGLTMSNKLTIMRETDRSDWGELFTSKSSFTSELRKFINNKTAKASNRQAAKQILQLIGS